MLKINHLSLKNNKKYYFYFDIQKLKGLKLYYTDGVNNTLLVHTNIRAQMGCTHVHGKKDHTHRKKIYKPERLTWRTVMRIFVCPSLLLPLPSTFLFFFNKQLIWFTLFVPVWKGHQGDAIRIFLFFWMHICYCLF